MIATLFFVLTESDYRTLRKEVEPTPVAGTKNKGAKVSPNYLKNLENLKKLTAQQFVFYNLFRELANELPDGVLLENIEYRFKDDKGTLIIATLAPLGNKVAATEYPGKVMAMFDRSSSLKNHREPTITTVTKEKEMFLKMLFTSEVKSFDTTN
jgi:hypothetical protein